MHDDSFAAVSLLHMRQACGLRNGSATPIAERALSCVGAAAPAGSPTPSDARIGVDLLRMGNPLDTVLA